MGFRRYSFAIMRETTWLDESVYTSLNKQGFVGLENETMHATEKRICMFIYYLCFILYLH